MGAAVLRAQTPTTVTATVVDPNAIPYAGGTVKAQLVPTPPGGPCVITGGNCVPVPGTAGPVLMSTTGGFTMNLYPNASILCGGQACTTQWSFQVCISPGVLTPFGTGPQCFSVSQTIAGATQDISAALKAGALALTVTPNFSGGTTSWANITSGTNTNTGAFVSTAGNYNFSSISLFQLPVVPNFTTSNQGQIGFDSTADNWHVSASSAVGVGVKLGQSFPGLTVSSGNANFTAGPMANAVLSNAIVLDLVVADAGNGLPAVFHGANSTLLPWSVSGGGGTLLTTPLSSSITVNAIISAAGSVINAASLATVLTETGTVTDVQNTSTSTTLTTRTFDSANSAGNTIITFLWATNGSSTQPILSANDMAGNVYTLIGEQYLNAGGRDPILVAMAIATNIKAAAAGNQITWTSSTGSFPFATVAATELTGIGGVADAILPTTAGWVNTDCLQGLNFNNSITIGDFGQGCAQVNGAVTAGHVAVFANSLTPGPGVTPILQDGGVATQSGAIIQVNSVTQASSVSLTANTFATVMSVPVTMPAACPCHVIVQWNAYTSGGGATPSFSAGVEDGSGSGELIAASQGASGGNTSAFGAAQYSPLTYSGNVTFTLVAASNASSGASIPATAVLTPAGYTSPGYLTILVIHP